LIDAETKIGFQHQGVVCLIKNDLYPYGFIPQDVEKLFPAFGFKGADNPAQDFYHLDYSGFGMLAL